MSSKSKQSAAPVSLAYISLWLLFACGAIGYIAYLFHTGPVKEKKLTELKTTTIKLAKQKDELAQLRAIISKTNHSLNQLNTKNALIQQKLAAIETSQLKNRNDEDEMLARLKKIEESLGSVTGALQQRRSKANAQKVVEKEQKDAPKEPIIKQQPEKKQPPAEMIDEKKLKQKKPEVAAKKPVLIQTNFAVALGDYSSLKQLKQAWKKISTKHKTDLAALSPRFVPVLHKNKVRYELISGPLKNALDAVQLCYRLLQAKTACKQAIFQGKNI